MSADVVKSGVRAPVRADGGDPGAGLEALAATLREHFADGDGRLPRTLERFLGDNGQLRRLTRDLFDENSRECARPAQRAARPILRRRWLAAGAAARPDAPGRPLHQFRGEVTDEFRRLSERITALEEAKRARAEERAKGTAKGADFEEALEERLGALAHGLGDLVEPTGAEGGDAMSSKKGDLVITIDPSRTRGQAAHRGRGQGPADAAGPHDGRAGTGARQSLGRGRAGRLHAPYGAELGHAAGPGWPGRVHHLRRGDGRRRRARGRLPRRAHPRAVDAARCRSRSTPRRWRAHSRS